VGARRIEAAAGEQHQSQMRTWACQCASDMLLLVHFEAPVRSLWHQLEARAPSDKTPSLCTCVVSMTCRAWHFPRAVTSQLPCRLLEWVGSCAPVCEEQTEADGLEEPGQNTDDNGVEWALLSDDGGHDLHDVNGAGRQGTRRRRRTVGPEDAKKIKLPRYAAPL